MANINGDGSFHTQISPNVDLTPIYSSLSSLQTSVSTAVSASSTALNASQNSLPPAYISGMAGNGNILSCLPNSGYSINNYQWIKTSSSGVSTAISGATSSTWTQTGLLSGDVISCSIIIQQYMPSGISIK